MPIAPLLQRFVDDELARSLELIDRVHAATLEQLRQPRDGMASLHEKQTYIDLAEALHGKQSLYRSAFIDSLRQLVLADMREHAANTAPDPLGDMAGALTLMDEARVESDIEVMRAQQVIGDTAEWELRELQTFTSTLIGQQHVTAESNPLRPISYARALWDAACVVTPVMAQRSILIRLSAVASGGVLRMAWAAAATRLEAQGVEPGVYRTVVLAPGATIDRPPQFNAPGAAMSAASSGSGMPVVSPQATPNLRDIAPPGGGQTRVAPAPGFEQSLLRLEEMLRALPGPSSDSHHGGNPSSPRLRDHQASLVAATPNMVDREVIDLLSRLFDTVLVDARLHSSFRTLIARLQTSALRVALHDTAMMQDQDHVVWQLMNRLGEVSAAYPQTGDPRLTTMLTFCEQLVADMAQASTQDLRLYQKGMARFDEFLQELVAQQLKQAQPQVDQLMRTERRDQLQRQLSQRLSEQMVPLRVSAEIRRFVTGAWAQVLAECIQRHGESVEPSPTYLRTVDDLLWSLKLPDHPQSRNRLVTLLPSLLQRLKSGMALISLPEAEQQHVLDELMAVHTEALRPGTGTAGGSQGGGLSAEQIVQQLRDEVDEPEEQPSRSFGDSLIDLSSMDTVPADLLDEAGSANEREPTGISALKPGSRRRLFLRGRWTRVQLLWHSPQGRFFLFAGESPGRTHSITDLALERLLAEKLLLPLEDKPLVQRAISALFRELGQQQPA
jgi:hypothetical protein